MYLAVNDLLQQISQKFTENPLVSLMPFFVGIAFGFVLCFLIYLLVIARSLKKTKKTASNVVLDVDNKVISDLINSAKTHYSDSTVGKPTGQKIACLKDDCWNLINDIAKAYYPESKYPLYELSINEVILLANYISNRIDELFSGRFLKQVKNVKISTVLKIIDIKKKYDQNKLVKTANKYKVPKGVKFILTALNTLNPAYWVRKIMIDGAFNIVVKKIALTIIDVVGEETYNVYSKNMFRLKFKSFI